MQTALAFLVLLVLNFVGFTASELELVDVCEPGQRAVSQFGEDPSTNAANLSSEETFLSGFTHFGHGLADQSLDPERHLAERVKDIHPNRGNPTIKEVPPGQEPLFTGAVWFHHQALDVKEIVFKEEHHVSGQVCNKTVGFQQPGKITYVQQKLAFFLPTKEVAKVEETRIPHPTGPLEEEPNGKVRRLLKVIKLAKRAACLT